MSSPQVTVVLPVYNGGATLAVALRSVLAQTFEDYELLVLDDGSTDNSLRVARSFSDCRLHVLSDGMRHGLAARLNQGVDFARGRYIARMDQDDICFPERLARQFDFLENHSEIDLLGCRAVVFRNAREIIGLVPFRRTHEEICTDPWRGLYLVHPSWMGRADWFRRHRYRIPEVVLAEDQELLLRAYRESRFACLDEVLLAYRKELRKNGAGVAPCAHDRGIGHRNDRLADGIRDPGAAHDVGERGREVRPRVSVGYGEDVYPVQLVLDTFYRCVHEYLRIFDKIVEAS